ncbi:aminotransferase class I/II-fold pyridoxal phosphate-dependent enzyme [Coleofasciculus sp. F4-SAH-05]|uniref:aminotransferase class I/II-fold pyridoxal phosphate-dependent enzyme n=1 Tax=Coleofasciculus sp. F4-SAH-05 TaxID=3069525 RepID=UPI004062D5E5
MRVDIWSQLKLSTDRLESLHACGKDISTLKEKIAAGFKIIEPLELYWKFPGINAFRRLQQHFERQEYSRLSWEVAQIIGLMSSRSELYAQEYIDNIFGGEQKDGHKIISVDKYNKNSNQLYFTVLFVEDDMTPEKEKELHHKIAEIASTTDKFIYQIIVVYNLENALTALMLNHTIQCCVIGYDFPLRSNNRLSLLEEYMSGLEQAELAEEYYQPRGLALGAILHKLRPELDLYLLSDVSLVDVDAETHQNFRRVFYNQEDYLEVHLSIIQGIEKRYETPFFDALINYSKEPTGVFHAMPISRGNSIFKSDWIQDMGEFYGQNLFLAETSATSGGLDSLLHPTGTLKKAQSLAAKSFGSRQTFFVTNGTSTANKIVLQAIVTPGDIVLVDQNCHKSHHYGIVLVGAQPLYLNAYSLKEYNIYGAVPLKEIKQQLLNFKRSGQLEQVKMVLLTNCTFDGIVYNVKQFMEEILAIKPDMVFLWDEAWFAFARCTSTYRERTAMQAASDLYTRYNSPQYRKEYAAFKEQFDRLDPEDDDTGLNQHLLPDPDQVKIRVYSTQSTHKSLSGLRQSSMIHIWDEDFNRKSEIDFLEAYMTHTSTSPNYQILASLDLARRQIELEGFKLVQSQIDMAMVVREKVNTHPLLGKYFKILTPEELIPETYRPSGLLSYQTQEAPEVTFQRIEQAWEDDEFVLDPTRLTLYIGKTGIESNTFQDSVLMEQFNIQLNKISLNTVLLMTNIGTTWGSVTYLLDCLQKIAEGLEQELRQYNQVEIKLFENKLQQLTLNLPSLPQSSEFYSGFRSHPATGQGDMRSAYFMGLDEEKIEYLKLDNEIDEIMTSGREIVSSTFIIPTPPGCPILVPGQVVTGEVVFLIKQLAPDTIHGYRPDFGLPVFTQNVLDSLNKTTGSAMTKTSAFTHLAIAVTNLNASISFYAKYGQMSVVRLRVEPGTVWMSDNIRPFALALLEEEEVKPILPPTHIGIACVSCEQVDQLCQLARKEGCLLEGPKDYGPPTGYAAYLRDPNGHHVEISYGQEAAYESRYTPYTELA